MGSKDYKKLAKEIIEEVGGKDNIESVTNCVTRLRFVLIDDKIPDPEVIKKHPEVKGVVNQGGQYQVIIGTEVPDVAKCVNEQLGKDNEKNTEAKSTNKVKEKNWFNRLFKAIAGCVMPMIGPMVASGLIKGLLAICTTIGILSSESGTYIVLYAASNAILYFLPIIVGFSAGKVFDCNPYITATIGAAMVYPDLITAVASEEGLKFLNISIANVTYSSTLFPIIMSSYVASKIEKLAKKIIPDIFKMMLVPTIVLLITVPASWLVIGPIMNGLSDILSTGLLTIWNFNPVIGGILFGGFWQLVVMLGIHMAFMPVIFNNLVTIGYDPLSGPLGLTVWALAGVSLGYALKMKDASKRSMGFTTMVSCLCGITEPTIYSIALPQVKCFVAAFIGGGVSGGIVAALGAKMYNWTGDGIFRIPAFINPEGIDISFFAFIICSLIAMIISAVITYFVADREM